jgi:hypothetical protein
VRETLVDGARVTVLEALDDHETASVLPSPLGASPVAPTAWSCPGNQGSNGFTTPASERATSFTLRVASVRPLVVLGMSARNATGVVMGQEVLKLSPNGQVLMTLGREGVSGNGPDTFDRPTGVAIAPNGDIFVTDGHLPNAHNNGRVLKFSKDGRFIKSWGKRGSASGDFDEPHDIFLGGSQNRIYVADRRNQRVQVFDQDGNFIAAWKQFGEPSSVFVGKDDTIYVGTGFPDPAAKRGEIRGIVVGNALDGSLKAFIPDPADRDSLTRGTTSSGIAADDEGSIYSADVAAHNLRKYVKVK